jgi:hypothetical protein
VTVRFFRLALLLPIVVPLLLWPAMRFSGNGQSPLFASALLFGGSLVIAGIPYLVFAIGAAWWARRRSSPELRRFALRAPFYFAPFAGTAYFLFGLATVNPPNTTWLIRTGADLALLAVVFGYVYVALGLALARLVSTKAGRSRGTARVPETQ